MDSWTDSFLSLGSGEGVFINNSNFTENETAVMLTCQQKQVEFGSPLPLPTNTANVLRYMQVVYYIICLPFGVFLNLFVVSLILRFKKLQTVTFVLAFQVIAGDLVLALIVFPTSAANAVADRFVFTGLCPVIGFIVFYLRITRFYLMLVLALDRFCTVFLPFWYQRNRHRVKTITVLSLLAWVLGFIVALVPVKGLLDCYSFQRNTWACVPTNGCINKNECSVYNSVSSALSNGCNIVSLLLYLSLFCKARQLRNKTVTVTVKAHQHGSTCEEAKAYSAQKQRRERQVNCTFFLLVFTLAVATSPAFFFFVVGRPIITTLDIVPPNGYVIAGIIGRATFPLLPIIDPIVIMRNADFREIIRKIREKWSLRQLITARRLSSQTTSSMTARSSSSQNETP